MLATTPHSRLRSDMPYRICHTVSGPSAHCMDAPSTPAQESAPIPLDLTDAELATAATACRAMAYQEGERVKKMENPTMRGRRQSDWSQQQVGMIA